MGTYDTTHGGALSPNDVEHEDAYMAIEAERNRQIVRWGNDFDDQHSQNDWVAFITAYAGKAYDTHAGTQGQYPNPKAFVEAMIKVGALAVAALDAHERYANKQEIEAMKALDAPTPEQHNPNT